MAKKGDLTTLKGFGSYLPMYRQGVGVGADVQAYLIDMAALKTSQVWTIDGSGGDWFYIMPIPIGCKIDGVLMQVTTACTDTGTATVAVGDYTAADAAVDADGYMAATSIKATGYTGTVIGDAYGAARKIYSAAHYLGLTFGGTETDINSGVFWMLVWMSSIKIPDLPPTAWH